MKKTLIALAVLAASGASFAQSSVTLYGILDIGYSQNRQATDSTFGINNSNISFHTPSRFGMKGSEDLGGGLKANFDMQTGNIDFENGNVTSIGAAKSTSTFTGTSAAGAAAAGTVATTTTVANQFFNREAWVGLSGNFGATRLGRTSSVATQGQASFDLNGISSSSAMSNIGIGPVTWYGSSRRSSQLQYTTPMMAGFDAGVAATLSGDNTVGGVNKSYFQGRVNYANGPIAAGVTAETKHADANRTAWAVAGSYDFGVAKVSAGYVVSELDNVASGAIQGGKGLHIGVKAPLGAAYVGAQYAKNTTSKDSAIEGFAGYNLSKRTSVYLDAVRVNFDNGALANTTKYGVGILHAF